LSKPIQVGNKAFLKIPVSEITGFGITLSDALMIVTNPVIVRSIEDNGLGYLILVESVKRPFEVWIDPIFLREVKT
jgi:hypothetical protein